MSNPERLIFRRVGITEELCVTPHTDEMDASRTVGVPREADVALVLSKVSDEWFSCFLRELQRRSPNRAMVVASIVAFAALEDVAGGDCDPGFAVDAADSAHLLQLRQAIDAIGWKYPADEEKGDYLARLHEIREELAIVDMAVGRALRAEKQVRTQRTELRRFNRDARARKEGAAAANVMSTHPKALPELDP